MTTTNTQKSLLEKIAEYVIALVAVIFVMGFPYGMVQLSHLANIAVTPVVALLPSWAIFCWVAGVVKRAKYNGLQSVEFVIWLILHLIGGIYALELAGQFKVMSRPHDNTYWFGLILLAAIFAVYYYFNPFNPAERIVAREVIRHPGWGFVIAFALMTASAVFISTVPDGPCEYLDHNCRSLESERFSLSLIFILIGALVFVPLIPDDSDEAFQRENGPQLTQYE